MYRQWRKPPLASYQKNSDTGYGWPAISSGYIAGYNGAKKNGRATQTIQPGAGTQSGGKNARAKKKRTGKKVFRKNPDGRKTEPAKKINAGGNRRPGKRKK